MIIALIRKESIRLTCVFKHGAANEARRQMSDADPARLWVVGDDIHVVSIRRPPTKKTSKSPAAVTGPRFGSKIGRLIELLRTGSGRSLGDMTEATGWQAHTVRAAMTGLRKRGHQIDRKVDGTATVWSISGGAA